MSVDEIIKEKLSRLNTIPDALITSVERVQRDLYTRLLELLSSLEKKGDVILQAKNNLVKIDEIIDGLKVALEDPNGQYYDAVKNFTDEIKIQQGLSTDYFVKVFGDSKPSSFAMDVAITTRKQAANLLLGSAVESSFFHPVREQITNAIISGSSYQETVKTLRDVVIGDAKKDGALQSHVKQIAHDSFAIADRSYATTLANENKAEWFNYRGSEIPTSRPFCKERHGHYYHRKEVEAWGDGKKTEGLRTPGETGEWSGEMLGTTKKTIFNFAGGYNCRHAIIAVSIARVPKEDIQRAIDQGFYTPKE